VGALVAVAATPGRMSALLMILIIGAAELWRYRQVLLVGAGLSLLVRYLADWARWWPGRR
jgi:hypothetical protein